MGSEGPEPPPRCRALQSSWELILRVSRHHPVSDHKLQGGRVPGLPTTRASTGAANTAAFTHVRRGLMAQMKPPPATPAPAAGPAASLPTQLT